MLTPYGLIKGAEYGQELHAYGYIPYDSTARTVREYNETLQSIYKCERAIHLILIGPVPDGADLDLLRKVCMTSMGIIVNDICQAGATALGKALADKDCTVEKLLFKSYHVVTLGRALEANRSLRLVDIQVHYDTSLVQSLVTSAVIQHVRLQVINLPVESILGGFLAMPSLLSIALGPYSKITPKMCSDVWPECVVTADMFCKVLLRYPHVTPFDKRQRVYALYECLEGVLPSGVIDDIAHHALMRVPDSGWWPINFF
jgi:hypothetical protein